MIDPQEAQALLSSVAVTPALAQLCGLKSTEVWWEIQRMHRRPGADTSVVYKVLDLRGEVQHVVLSTARADNARTFWLGHSRVIGWRHPYDPKLPGLAEACDPRIVAQWLAVPRVDIEMLSYRPLRRAVLRATSNAGTKYIKVLSAGKAIALRERHQVLGKLAPAIVGEPTTGVLLLESAVGQPLASCLAAERERPNGVPAASDFVSFLRSLPPATMDLDRRDAWTDRLDTYSAGAIAEHPELRHRISRLATDISTAIERSDRGPLTGSHGDFYEANIFAAGGRLTQVIDVDSLGPGFMVDDLACLLGHTSVLPTLSPTHYRGVEPVLVDWLSQFDQATDPIALRARTAGVILSLMLGAAGPQAETRLGLAEGWIASVTT